MALTAPTAARPNASGADGGALETATADSTAPVLSMIATTTTCVSTGGASEGNGATIGSLGSASTSCALAFAAKSTAALKVDAAAAAV